MKIESSSTRWQSPPLVSHIACSPLSAPLLQPRMLVGARCNGFSPVAALSKEPCHWDRVPG
jgi:hypothetical protein